MVRPGLCPAWPCPLAGGRRPVFSPSHMAYSMWIGRRPAGHFRSLEKEHQHMKRSLATVMAVLLVGAVALGTRVDVTQATAHTAAVSMDKYGATTLSPVGMSKVRGAAAIFSEGGRLYVDVSVS